MGELGCLGRSAVTASLALACEFRRPSGTPFRLCGFPGVENAGRISVRLLRLNRILAIFRLESFAYFRCHVF